jgi:hypothetical protein
MDYSKRKYSNTKRNRRRTRNVGFFLFKNNDLGFSDIGKKVGNYGKRENNYEKKNRR